MEKQTHLINPINYIINTEELKNYECIICMTTSLQMLQCSTCHKCFCYNCTTDLSKKFNKCPQKCSSFQLQVQPIPQMKIQFRCPFSKDCIKIFTSIKQFWKHQKQCQYMNQTQKKQYQNKTKFLCKNSHNLQIILQPYAIISTRRLCSGCGNQSNIRSTCKKCSLIYCNSCRPFPVYKNKCPMNHTFQFVQYNNLQSYCDCCSLSLNVFAHKYYRDYFCNFDICDHCYQIFPQLQQPINYISNHKNYCDLVGKTNLIGKLSSDSLSQFIKKHRLQLLPQRALSQCNWCEQIKLCYKKCVQCQKYYCITCKPFQIMHNFCCDLGHRFKSINIPFQQQPKDTQKKIVECFVCQNEMKQKRFLQDPQCKIILCPTCFRKQIKRNQLRQRKISINGIKCQNNCYAAFQPWNNNKYILQQFCYLCHQPWICKFFCYCKQLKYYCCKCIPPKNNKICYCDKSLKKISNFYWEQCMQCGTPVDNPFGCQPCHYLICDNCYNNGYQHILNKQKDVNTICNQLQQKLQEDTKPSLKIKQTQKFT